MKGVMLIGYNRGYRRCVDDVLNLLNSIDPDNFITDKDLKREIYKEVSKLEDKLKSYTR